MSKAKATVKYQLCQFWNLTNISTNQVWARLPPQSHHRILSLLDTGNLWQGEGCRNQVKLHLLDKMQDGRVETATTIRYKTLHTQNY